MAATQILLATTLFFAPPTDAPASADAPSARTVRQRYRAFKRHGLVRVAKAYINASDAYRAGIARAYAEADPAGAHPEWLHEVWRICHRESWCGKWGTPKVHEEDGWAGAQVWAGAAVRGKLDPVGCEEHRLSDYGPVRKRTDVLVKRGRWGSKRAAKVHALLDTLEDLPAGHHTAAEFSTNGGFGMMAAGNLRRLGSCVGPEAMADPYNGARAAFDLFATCTVWEGEPGHRYRRSCTCSEHTALWVGKGRFAQRPLFAWSGERSRFKTVRTQCGEAEALAYAWDEVTSELGVAVQVVAVLDLLDDLMASTA